MSFGIVAVVYVLFTQLVFHELLMVTCLFVMDRECQLFICNLTFSERMLGLNPQSLYRVSDAHESCR